MKKKTVTVKMLAIKPEKNVFVWNKFRHIFSPKEIVVPSMAANCTHPLLKVTPALISSLLWLATTGCWVEWSTSICSLSITAVLSSVKAR